MENSKDKKKPEYFQNNIEKTIDPEEQRIQFDQRLVRLREHYGQENVRVEDAFNVNAKPLFDMKGIYIKKEKVREQPVRIEGWKKSDLELRLENEDWVLIGNFTYGAEQERKKFFFNKI